MNNKKRVLFFLQAGVGGAERISIVLAKCLNLGSYNVSFVLVGEEHGSSEIKEFIPSCYRCILIPKSPNGFVQVFRYYNIIKSEEPDFVFSSVFHLNTKLLPLSLCFKNTKFIVRNNIGLYRLNLLQKFIAGFSYLFANNIICQTEEMEKEINHVFPFTKKNTCVIHNPLDIDTIDKLKNEYCCLCEEKRKPIYVASGRYSKEKGYETLLHAFSLVLRKQPNASLYILGNKTGGNAAYALSLEKLAKELDIQDNVVFWGYTKNPYSMVRNADCYVQSSYAEGLPNALIEAQYLGIPAAATTCVPVVERIVKEGKTGFLTMFGNSDSLADAMINASQLGRINNTYKPDSLEKFKNLF